MVLCKMRIEIAKTIAAIVGPILGLIGLFYGFIKDRTLRQIKKRANSPFFKVYTMQVSVAAASRPEGGKLYYHYHREPKSLSARSFLETEQNDVPEDYPDGHPVGFLLRNIGSELRSFKITSGEKIVFQEADVGKNLYELRYIFSRASRGEAFRFSITFETSEGFQGTQTWEVIRGTKSMRRVRPRTPCA